MDDLALNLDTEGRHVPTTLPIPNNHPPPSFLSKNIFHCHITFSWRRGERFAHFSHSIQRTGLYTVIIRYKKLHKRITVEKIAFAPRPPGVPTILLESVTIDDV